jgi:hypothetical protein
MKRVNKWWTLGQVKLSRGSGQVQSRVRSSPVAGQVKSSRGSGQVKSRVRSSQVAGQVKSGRGSGLFCSWVRSSQVIVTIIITIIIVTCANWRPEKTRCEQVKDHREGIPQGDVARSFFWHVEICGKVK